jgi:hypothetical protein
MAEQKTPENNPVTRVSRAEIEQQVEVIIAAASPKKPKPWPPLDDNLRLAEDLNYGQVRQAQLANNYNDDILSNYPGHYFVGPRDTIAASTVGAHVDLVWRRANGNP